MQTLIDPLSTAFELLTKAKAQHREQQQAAVDSSNVATSPGPGAAGGNAGGASALLQQVLQLESKVCECCLAITVSAFCHIRHCCTRKPLVQAALHNGNLPVLSWRDLFETS